jgi:hypothetical protein
MTASKAVKCHCFPFDCEEACASLCIPSAVRHTGRIQMLCAWTLVQFFTSLFVDTLVIAIESCPNFLRTVATIEKDQF